MERFKPEEYGPGDWTNGEVEAAKALWDAHNRHHPHTTVGDAWLVYLYDARTCFAVFKSFN